MAMNMRLNNLDRGLFAYRTANDETIGSGANKISRNQIIASGRVCAAEYMGKAISGNTGSFKSKFEGQKTDYATMSKKHSEEKFLFCAARAYAACGAPAPESFEQVKNDRSLWKDNVFLRTLARIDMEVITPMLFDVFNDLGGSMFNMSSIPFGSTREIVVDSNEVFLWEDGSLGSGHSTTKNYLYQDSITLNPRLFNANATIKWAQLMANDSGMDTGHYYAALIRGMWSKIMAITTNALTDTATQAQYVPSYLRFNSYNSANWAAATTAVAVANGVPRDRLMAFGQYSALQAILPSGTPSDAALTYGISEEWVRNGFVGMVGRVPLYEVLPAMVPNTINTTGDLIGLGDQVFITARVGDALAPVYVVFADGWPVTLEYTASETANFTIDILMSTMMDVKPIWGGRIGILDNVSL